MPYPGDVQWGCKLKIILDSILCNKREPECLVASYSIAENFGVLQGARVMHLQSNEN